MLDSITLNLIRTNLFLEAPEFKTSVPEQLDIVDYYIQKASNDVNANLFKDRVNDGIVLLTAHNLTVKNPLKIDNDLLRNEVGSITKKRRKNEKTEKEMFFSSGSRSSGKNSIYDSDFSASNYGIDYFILLKKCRINVDRILLA